LDIELRHHRADVVVHDSTGMPLTAALDPGSEEHAVALLGGLRADTR